MPYVKILFVNERCGYAGGIEQNVADTSTGLRARGHQCFLVYGATTGQGDIEGYKQFFDGCFQCSDLGSDKSQDSFETIVKRVNPGVIYLHKFREVRPFEQVLSGAKTIRVVHDHDLCCPTGLKYFRLSGRICTVKAGWRCWLDGGFLARDMHAPLGFKFSGIGSKLQEMRRNMLLDMLVVDSRFMREELIDNGFPPEKVHILPHIVRLPECTPEPVPQAPNILYVGQLIRGKGVDLLLHALAAVTCEYSARIVGTGNARAKLETLSEQLHLTEKVKFEGWVAHDQLDSYYSWAKLVAVPSRWAEPYGMVGLEAMNHARATVAFTVGGIPDWLVDGENGLLVDPQDTAAYAHALERLLLDTDLAARMGAVARDRIERDFSFEKYLDDVEGLLDVCVSQSRGPKP